MNWKGFGTKRTCPNRRTILASSYREAKKILPGKPMSQPRSELGTFQVRNQSYQYIGLFGSLVACRAVWRQLAWQHLRWFVHQSNISITHYVQCLMFEYIRQCRSRLSTGNHSMKRCPSWEAHSRLICLQISPPRLVHSSSSRIKSPCSELCHPIADIQTHRNVFGTRRGAGI